MLGFGIEGDTAVAKFSITDPIYHDNDAARAHLEGLLWPHGPSCPRCGVLGDRITKLQGKSTRPGVYKCKDCRKPFSVTVGTVMERSHIPLCKWVLASQLLASSKKGFSAHELHRVLGTNYETAWFLFHRLREAMNDPAAGPLGGKNEMVEVDETYIGGKEKNKHAVKRKHEGRGAVGKMPVVSLVCREGDVRSFYVASVTASTLRPILAKHMSAEANLDDRRQRGLRPDRQGLRVARHGEPLCRRVHEDGRLSPHEHGREPLRAPEARACTARSHNISEAHLGRLSR